MLLEDTGFDDRPIGGRLRVFLAFELQYLFFGLAWALANGAGDRLADLDAGVA